MADKSAFTDKEKQEYLIKKHLKEKAFEYIADMVITILVITVVLVLCKAENLVYGIILAAVYSLGKTAFSLNDYKAKLKREVRNKKSEE